jgi:hypothetical protein
MEYPLTLLAVLIYSEMKHSLTLVWSYELAGLFTQLNTCRFLCVGFSDSVDQKE